MEKRIFLQEEVWKKEKIARAFWKEEFCKRSFGTNNFVKSSKEFCQKGLWKKFQEFCKKKNSSLKERNSADQLMKFMAAGQNISLLCSSLDSWVLERQLELRVSFFSVAMAGSDCSANPATLTAEQEAREEEEVALQSESDDYFDLWAVAEEFKILSRQSAGVIVRIMGTLEAEYGDDRQLLQRSSTSWTRVQTALNPQAALPQSRRTLGRTVTIPQVPMKMHINCDNLGTIEEQTCSVLSPSDDQILYPLCSLQQLSSATPPPHTGTNVACAAAVAVVSGSAIIPPVELLSPTTSADGNEEDQTYSEAAEAVEVPEVAPEDVSNSVPELDSSSFAASLDDGGLVDDAGEGEVVVGILRPAAAAAACNKVVVVVDGEKKPSTTALDRALTQVVKQDQGDEITILAFLQQVTSPSKNQNPSSMDHLSLSLPLSHSPRKSTVKSLFLCLARNWGRTKRNPISWNRLLHLHSWKEKSILLC